MATYAEVINNNGKVVIDDSTARLCRTRTLSLTPGYTTWGSYYYDKLTDIPDNAINGLSVFNVQLASHERFVAIRAKTGHDNVAVMAEWIDSTHINVYLVGCLNNPNTYADDYLIDVYGSDPNRSYNNGLQIFNSSATKIFDSNEYIMSVAGTYNNNVTYLLAKKLQTEFPKTISIGSGPSTGKNSIAIGSCGRVLGRSTSESYGIYQGYYGVTFGSNETISLKLRCSVYTQLSGGLPTVFTGTNSGIILNHENIPARNDGTLT